MRLLPERVRLVLRVRLREPLPDSGWRARLPLAVGDEPARVRVGLPVAAPVTERDAGGEAVPLGDGASEWLLVALDDGVPVGLDDGMSLALGEPVPVALSEDVPDRLPVLVPVALGEGVPVWLREPLGLLEPLAMLLPVALPVELRLALALPVAVALGVPEGLRSDARSRPRYVSRATASAPPPTASHSTDSSTPLASRCWG